VVTMFDLCVVCSNDMNSVVVITPPIAIGSRLSEELLILLQLNDGSVLDTNHTFTYRLNPVFTDIEPRNHLLVYVSCDSDGARLISKIV